MKKKDKTQTAQDIQGRSGAILEQELNWLEMILSRRLDDYLNKQKYREPDTIDISDADSYYAKFVQKHELSIDERKIVLLAVAALVRPEILDMFYKLENSKKSFIEFGGIYDPQTKNYVPTVKTALYMLCGNDISEQMQHIGILNGAHRLYREKILEEDTSIGESMSRNQLLLLSRDSFNQIFMGTDMQYEYSSNFPATQLHSNLEWEDLVLSDPTRNSLKELLAWLDYGPLLFSKLELGKNIQPGYRALFYGPPGTGKTVTAALLGKKINRPVYRIDLSQMVSKYVGETEKNLEKIFKTAEKRDWILFFDEADALFGKRTSIGSANDRFANQETAYLLQRIENYNNVVILASNMKKNLDEAFTRRFQSVVYFPMPEKIERLTLWNGMIENKVVLDPTIDLAKIAETYDLAGGSIVNVLRYIGLMALEIGKGYVSKEVFMEGIKREYNKMGRTL